MILKVITTDTCKCCKEWATTVKDLQMVFPNLEVEYYDLKEMKENEDLKSFHSKLKGVPFSILFDNEGTYLTKIEGAMVYKFAYDKIKAYDNFIV